MGIYRIAPLSQSGKNLGNLRDREPHFSNLLRPVKDLLYRVMDKNSALVHNQGGVGIAGNVLHRVGDQQDR